MTSGAGFEWVLLGVGAVMTLALVIFFVVVLRSKDDK